jgi:hypothetical protein
MIEAFFFKINDKDVNTHRLWHGLEKCKKWYRGDGVYSDGEEVHVDYYNSYIIHPMLTDILCIIRNENQEWDQLYKKG